MSINNDHYILSPKNFPIRANKINLEKQDLNQYTPVIGGDCSIIIEILLGLRWDTANSTWLAKTFDADGDWWGGLQSSTDANNLSTVGASYSTNSYSSQWSGNIGNVLYDTDHEFEILSLYSDMGTTEVEFDKNNFYVENNNSFRESDPDYNHQALLICSFNEFSTQVKSWKVRIEKKQIKPDGVAYLSPDKSPVQLSTLSSISAYDENGSLIPILPIAEGGDRYIILKYYTSTEEITGNWVPNVYTDSVDGNLVLKNSSDSNITIQRFSYRIARNPNQRVYAYLDQYKNQYTVKAPNAYNLYSDNGNRISYSNTYKLLGWYNIDGVYTPLGNIPINLGNSNNILSLITSSMGSASYKIQKILMLYYS